MEYIDKNIVLKIIYNQKTRFCNKYADKIYEAINKLQAISATPSSLPPSPLPSSQPLSSANSFEEISFEEISIKFPSITTLDVVLEDDGANAFGQTTSSHTSSPKRTHKSIQFKADQTLTGTHDFNTNTVRVNPSQINPKLPTHIVHDMTSIIIDFSLIEKFILKKGGKSKKYRKLKKSRKFKKSRKHRKSNNRRKFSKKR